MEQSAPEEDTTVLPEEAAQPEEVSDAEWQARQSALLVGGNDPDTVLANLESARKQVRIADTGRCPLHPAILEDVRAQWEELFPEGV